MDWKQATAKINKEAESIQWNPPDQVLRLFKHQIVPTGQGTRGQAFTTMVFCEGDCRALAYYGVLCLARLVNHPDFTLEHMKTLFMEFVPLSAEFQATCGLEKQWELVQDMMGVLDTLKTKDDFKELMDAMIFYSSALHGWVHNFFPWYIGELFPQVKAEDLKEKARLMK